MLGTDGTPNRDGVRLGRIIRDRRALNMTQPELAERAGVSPAYIYMLEVGGSRTPGWKTCCAWRRRSTRPAWPSCWRRWWPRGRAAAAQRAGGGGHGGGGVPLPGDAGLTSGIASRGHTAGREGSRSGAGRPAVGSRVVDLDAGDAPSRPAPGHQDLAPGQEHGGVGGPRPAQGGVAVQAPVAGS